MSRSDSPRKAQFHWDDPLLLNEQLTDEERMVRDAAACRSEGSCIPVCPEGAIRLEWTLATGSRLIGRWRSVAATAECAR